MGLSCRLMNNWVLREPGPALANETVPPCVASDERIVRYRQVRPYRVERGLPAQAELYHRRNDPKEPGSRVEVVAGEVVDAIDPQGCPITIERHDEVSGTRLERRHERIRRLDRKVRGRGLPERLVRDGGQLFRRKAPRTVSPPGGRRFGQPVIATACQGGYGQERTQREAHPAQLGIRLMHPA